MKHGLTKRQHQCLDFIEGFIDEHGYSPSYYEIMLGVGITSKSVVYGLVNNLEDRGHITRLPGKGRSIRHVV